jgi:hypothetical protein
MGREINIRPFLDGNGKITQLPKKLKVQLAVLAYLAGKFERDRNYTEREVNAVCDAWHSFGDFFLLRRELVDYDFLNRERDGSRYWRPPAG